MSRFFLFLLSGILVSSTAAQDSPKNDRQLRRALSEIVEADTLGNALIAVKVVRGESGKTLFAHNEKKTLMPASNAKLYTTAAALDQLGPDFTYTTELFAERGLVTNGVLESNLVVKGSGDPVIGGRYNEGDITAVFRAWADSLKAAGIARVQGDIIGDDNLFDDLQLGYGWSWDDEPWWYSAEMSALSLNDNVVDFTLEPGTLGGAGHLSWTPLNTTYVDVLNASVTVDSTEGLDEGYTRVRDGNQMVVSTEVPLGYTETESISIHNPTLYFVHVLREVLVSEGIAVIGQAVDVDDLSIAPNFHHAVRLASHTSPPMRQIADAINKPSHNLYAELVLKTLGVVLPDTSADASPGSAEAGWEAGMRTLAAAKVDTSVIKLVDGSGLSRMNLVSPEMTTDLLYYMRAHPDTSVWNAFYDSLPIAGVDGTLEFRMRGTSAEGNARAKTGTLTGASALSGYVTSTGGSELIYSIIVNNHTSSSRPARELQDQIVETLARFRR